MSPEDFEALLKICPDELVEEYWLLCANELTARASVEQPLAVSTGAFVPEVWSREIKDKLTTNLTMSSMGKKFFGFSTPGD